MLTYVLRSCISCCELAENEESSHLPESVPLAATVGTVARTEARQGVGTAETAAVRGKAELALQRATTLTIPAATVTVAATDGCCITETVRTSERSSAGEEAGGKRDGDVPREANTVAPAESPITESLRNNSNKNYDANSEFTADAQKCNIPRDNISEFVTKNSPSLLQPAKSESQPYDRSPVEASTKRQLLMLTEEKYVDLSDEVIENERPPFFGKARWVKASQQYGFGALKPFCQLCLHLLRSCSAGGASHSEQDIQQKAKLQKKLHTTPAVALDESDLATRIDGEIPLERRAVGSNTTTCSSTDHSRNTAPFEDSVRLDDNGTCPHLHSYSSSLLPTDTEDSLSTSTGNKTRVSFGLSSTVLPTGSSANVRGSALGGGDPVCEEVCGSNCAGLGASLTRRQKCLWCAADGGRCTAWMGCQRDCEDVCSKRKPNTRHEVERIRRRRQRILHLYKDGKLDEFLSPSWKRRYYVQKRPKSRGKGKVEQRAQPSTEHGEGHPHEMQQQPRQQYQPKRQLHQQGTSEHLQQQQQQRNFAEVKGQNQRGKCKERQPKKVDESGSGKQQKTEQANETSEGSRTTERWHRDTAQALTEDLVNRRRALGMDSSEKHSSTEVYVGKGTGEHARSGREEEALERVDATDKVGPAKNWKRQSRAKKETLLAVKESEEKFCPAKSASGFALEVSKKEVLDGSDKKVSRETKRRSRRKRGHADQTITTGEVEKLITRLLLEEEEERKAAEVARRKEETRKANIEAIEKRNEELARGGREKQRTGKATEKNKEHKKQEQQHPPEEEDEKEFPWMSPKKWRQLETEDLENFRMAVYTHILD